MEQLPLTFNQATVDPDIQECFTPAYNFTRINSSNGRLAFTTGKVYWLPDAPMAMMDQGWVINISEIAGCSKFGLGGFLIKLTGGKELRFSNVNQKMRDGIMAAIEEHKNDVVAAPEPTPAASPAPAADPVVAAPEIDPQDVSSNKVMAILAYFGILVLVPLFAAKESKFARFHANQGLILLICCAVIFAVDVTFKLHALTWLLDTAVMVFSIIGIVHAAKGEAKELPLIGKFRIIS